MALQTEHTFNPETGCEEYARLSALASIDILDTSPEPVYNAITRLAALRMASAAAPFMYGN